VRKNVSYFVDNPLGEMRSKWVFIIFLVPAMYIHNRLLVRVLSTSIVSFLFVLNPTFAHGQQASVKRIVNPLTDNIRPETEQNKKIYDSKYGDWGVPYPPSGNTRWVKIPVKKGSHNGVGLRNNLFPNGTEGWVSYNLRMVNWNSDDGMKLPGLSGNVTSGSWGDPERFKITIGGNGGGGAGGTELGPDNKGKSWSARMFIGGGPNNPAYRGRLGYYLYHKDSTNVHRDGRVFGTMGWWTQNGVESREVLDEEWHNVKMYVKLNDIGRNNGVLRGYFDGRLAYERTNLSFADNPKYRNVALYFNVYHGGSKVAPDDYEVHIDNIRYNAGSRDMLGDGRSSGGDDDPVEEERVEPLELLGEPSYIATETGADVNFLISDYSQAYVEYGETKTNTESGPPEESFKYKDHLQRLRDLEPGTTYYYRIHFSGEESSNKNLVSDWFSLTTKGGGDDEDSGTIDNKDSGTTGYQRVINPIAERDSSRAAQLGSSSMGAWGGPPPPSGASEWLRVPVRTGDFYGTGYKVPVLPDSTEGWISYQIRLDNWEKSKHSMKLPGPSAKITGNAPNRAAFPTAIGGNGGGGAGGTTGGPEGKGKSWSARMIISGVNTQYTANAQLGYELYHRDSTNIHADGRQFGEPEWWDKNGWNTAYIRDGNWHHVKHYVRLNDIGKSNGILRGYLNGKLSYERTNISFADNPDYREIALFLNVYHGGSTPATDDFAVYMDDIRYNAGAIDRTDGSPANVSSMARNIQEDSENATQDNQISEVVEEEVPEVVEDRQLGSTQSIFWILVERLRNRRQSSSSQQAPGNNDSASNSVSDGSASPDQSSQRTVQENTVSSEQSVVVENNRSESIPSNEPASGDVIRIEDPVAENNYLPGEWFTKVHNSSMGNWGSPPPPSGSNRWLRVPVARGTQEGICKRHILSETATEGWLAFNARLVNWERSEDSMKLPGFSAMITQGASDFAAFETTIGGNGGGGSGGTVGGPDGKGKSWSARMFVGGVNHDYTAKAQLGYELYHRDSENVLGDGRVFGDPEHWSKRGWNTATLRDENWHSIKQYVKLNDIGRSNGVLRGYLDGQLSYERTNISFADNPEYRNLALFNCVYHGGSNPAAADFEFHMDDIRFNAGSVDETN